jgi:hypothetical protein
MLWMSGSFLLDSGWWFFTAWSVVVAAVNLAALGRDLLPFRERPESLRGLHPIDPAQPGESGAD